MRPTALLAVLLLVATACGGEAEPGAASPAEADQTDGLSVAVASFDLAIGEDQRLLAGVYTPERELLGFGEVTFQLGYLGEQAGGETAIDQSVTASFLPVPGREPEGEASAPTFLEDPLGQGVYDADVDLDRAGNWGLRVVAELEDGSVLEGQTTFVVAEEHEVVEVGEPAPRSANATIEDVEAGRVEPVALDSRAQGDDPTIPDPDLHERTVEDVLEEGRPALVAIATPVYCVSQFCGPLIEVLADLAAEHEDRVETIHLEVWEDFDEKQLNEAAAGWIQTETGGNEPWVFLVDGDGTVVGRWDNVLDLDELEAAIDSLPTVDSPTAAADRS